MEPTNSVVYRRVPFNLRIWTLEPEQPSTKGTDTKTASSYFTIINDWFESELLVVRSGQPLNLEDISSRMGSTTSHLLGGKRLPARELVPPGTIIASARWVGQWWPGPYPVISFYHTDRRGRPDKTDRMLSVAGSFNLNLSYSLDLPTGTKEVISWGRKKGEGYFRTYEVCTTADGRELAKWHHNQLTIEDPTVDDELAAWLVATFAVRRHEILRDTLKWVGAS